MVIVVILFYAMLLDKVSEPNGEGIVVGGYNFDSRMGLEGYANF